MNITGFDMLILFFMLGGGVLFVVALVDLVRRPSAQWAASVQNQLMWVLIVIFVAFLGPILYLAIARPALKAASSRQ